MLKSLAISNYESHRSTFIELDPGLNAFVGTNDIGKSSILRAAVWAIMNQPVGDSYRSWWGGDPEVTLELVDGTIVRRSRTKSKNQYFLTDPSKGYDELPFDAVGRGGVPEEIEQALDIDTDISIRDQASRHFLLAETPSERARILNKTVKLDIIDTAMSRINSMQHETREALKAKTVDLEKVTKDLDGLKGLDELDGKIAVAEGLEKESRSARSEGKKLEALLSDLEQGKERLGGVKPMAELGPRMADLLKRQEDLGDVEEIAERLRVLVSRLRKTQEALANARAISALNDRLGMLEAKSSRLAKAKEQVESLEKYIESAKNTRTSKKDALKLRLELEARFEDMFPSTCPLCNRSCNCEN